MKLNKRELSYIIGTLAESFSNNDTVEYLRRAGVSERTINALVEIDSDYTDPQMEWTIEQVLIAKLIEAFETIG